MVQIQHQQMLFGVEAHQRGSQQSLGPHETERPPDFFADPTFRFRRAARLNQWQFKLHLTGYHLHRYLAGAIKPGAQRFVAGDDRMQCFLQRGHVQRAQSGASTEGTLYNGLFGSS